MALQAVAASPPDLPVTEPTQMSLEDLMKVEVTSVSRKAQRLTDVAAAAFVLTAEDIARAGATSLPEALRLVPGLDVARIAGAPWAVSSRGFNGRFANKLLVLVDGRSVYSPLYSGVFWEAQDVVLEDLERIEVIRGPGAALWGANAVNGVINIITKKARATQGTLVSALTGNVDRGALALRHGGQVDEHGWYRVWAKGRKIDGSTAPDGRDGGDDAQAWQFGSRWDAERPDGSRSAAIVGLAANTSTQTLYRPLLTPPYVAASPLNQRNDSAYLLGRHERLMPDGAQASLQGYVDHTGLSTSVADETRDTLDLDFQLRQAFGVHDLIWGAGYRHSRGRAAAHNLILVGLESPREASNLYSLFVHDDIELVPARWRAIVGSKLEHHTYGGLQLQPNLRLLYTPTATDTVWSAVSRAARTPSRAERDVTAQLAVNPPGSPQNPGPLPVLITARPNDGLRSERVTAYEIGWRTQVANAVSVDLAAFHNRYRHLRAGSSLPPVLAQADGVPYIDASAQTSSNLDAQAHGVELAADWHPAQDWRLQAAYTWLRVKARRNGDPAHDNAAAMAEGSAPHRQIALRSSTNLGTAWQLDLGVRHVGELRVPDVEAYTTLDARLAWRATRRLEVSLIGQNLTDRRHVEFITDNLPSQTLEVGRAVAVQARWEY